MEFRVGALARADKRRTGIQGPASIVKTDCRDVMEPLSKLH